MKLEPVMWTLSPPPAVPLDGVRAWTEDEVVVLLSETPRFTGVVLEFDGVDAAAAPLEGGTVVGRVVADRPVAGEP
jgi:hypothetical protein